MALLEQKEEIETPLLQQISQVLHIPVEVFKNFDEEQAVNVISNTFSTHDTSLDVINPYCNFNPTDRIVQLYDEKIALYERMLKEKDEMIGRLERLIGEM